MHVRQAEIAALEFVSQLRVIQAQQVQHGGVQVVDVHPVFHHVEAKFVGLADA